MNFLRALAAAAVALVIVYTLFGPLPPWVTIPLALFISVPLSILWKMGRIL